VAEEYAVFIACPSASMTYVSRTPDPSGLLSKLQKWSPIGVEMVAEVAASRGAVAAVQRRLNGKNAHGQWFDGLVDAEEAERLVAEGERDASAPSGGEVNSFKYLVAIDLEVVADGHDDDLARIAYEQGMARIREMEARVVAESHRELCRRLRVELREAGEARA
jgi:hypothetical protein